MLETRNALFSSHPLGGCRVCVCLGGEVLVYQGPPCLLDDVIDGSQHAIGQFFRLMRLEYLNGLLGHPFPITLTTLFHPSFRIIAVEESWPPMLFAVAL